ncbi:MAG: hypothetical protein GTN62_09370 [Gemmatimonadales bacterium]|nr:hypothetical protein [Gemmatimonadales bacterium]NIN11699.1 hypothetical protein [Gemmatimonadales bacterium]NIN50305.1 hypothetical protein [Gemmatimonadales bacterium]NIP07769.1 hypothetical protein [Gemmatimonadales bacterium]NIQ99172.1 hypothetical protein [Gemmatimonadales bacterium]
MDVGLLAMLQQGTQPRPSTIIQAIWLGTLILFVVAVFVTGFTAKQINNIHRPTYTKAFIALFLAGPLTLAGFFIFGLFFQAPPLVAFGVAYVLIPIALYKIVFSSMWREAALIWLVVTVVEAGVAYLLILVGLLSLAAVTGGGA